MKRKKYSNQNKKQILAHLLNLLRDKQEYTLTTDALGTYYMIRESQIRIKNPTAKKKPATKRTTQY